MEEMDNSIIIDFQCLDHLNLALDYNGCGLIRHLSIENKTEENYNNLILEIKPGIDFADPINIQIPEIQAGAIIELKPQFDTKLMFLLQVAEEMKTDITVNLVSEGKTLASQKFPLNIMPPNFWVDNIYGEVLSAFVMPNLNCISQIMTGAAQILQQSTGDPTMNGYESRDINRVRQITAAIYEALKAQQITYDLPPEDYVNVLYSQRIRLSDEVLANKRGTCIETALLIASCLECAHLYPIIVLIKGHAFVGVHLLPETFPYMVSDDVTELTKRLANGTKTIEVIESTVIDLPNNIPFEDACTLGANNLIDITEFDYFIDVKFCKIMGIKTLPRLVNNNGVFEIEKTEVDYSKAKTETEEISIYDIPSIMAKNGPVTKQTIWERKLLDLSLRNTLLNLKFGKKNIILLSSGVNKIEDYLSGGDEFKVLPRPAELKTASEDFDDVNVTIAPGSILENFVLQEVESKRLHSLFSDSENEAALKALYRDSRASLEENGANTLYLAIGLLRWYETDKVENPRYAPILLLPIEIIKRNSTSGYIIRGRDEDVIANITLSEMLRQNFDINLGLPDPLPMDESGVDVPKILAIVRHAILNQSRWDVEEKAVIGNFSFNKFVMWNDIHSHADLLAKNKIVNSLIEGRLTYEQTSKGKNAEQMDTEYTPAQMLLPVSSDSSQLEAVEEAVSGNSYIMFGPPGSGKSQTITNIIANALYRGQRVLFVAQKAAALEVVRTRLEKLGLGPFCLDVFSNKANKSQVLSQLNSSIEITRYKEPADFAADAQKLMELRKELNGMMESTHKPLPCGMSLYEAINQYVAMDPEIQPEIQFPFGLIGNASKDLVDIWKGIVNDASVIAKSMGNPSENPLKYLDIKTFDNSMRDSIEKSCADNIAALNTLKTSLESCNEILKVEKPYDGERFAKFQNVLKTISEIKSMNAAAASFSDTEGKANMYFTCLEHGKISVAKKAKILKIYNESILQRDWNETLRKWQESEKKFFISRWFAQRDIKKELRQYMRSDGEVHPDTDLNNLIDYQAETKLANTYSEINAIFDGMPSGTEQDWADRENLLRGILQIDDMLKKLAGDPVKYQNLKQNFSQMFAQGFKMYQDFYGARFQSAADNINKLSAATNQIMQLGDLDREIAPGNGSWIENRTALMKGIAANLDGLKDWYIYLNSHRKAEENSMQFAMEFFDQTDLEPEKWSATFQKSLLKAICDHVFAIDE
ncbi:MAG: DUF4011 domain-containing protein, partial [Bacteroidales bacterium]|nr:DUF4011 domain-containing protein [Bacteroidales bacterium]